MKPSIRTLGEILYSPSQYVIPVFQRNYRWEEPQWSKLWENVIEIQSPNKRGNHFLGFLVFVSELPQPGQNTTFYLVDGQQRLASSSILLAAVRNIARKLGELELADEIHQYYLVHPLKKGEQHYRLLPKERDHDNYLALIAGKNTAAGRMADALRYFEAKVATRALDSPERLRPLFDTICQRLEFMCATLETENAYNIFKSLNSTGVPLGPADLIRNFVFMHVPPGEQDEFDRELWAPLEERFIGANGTLDEEQFSSFFRDYLMSRQDTGYISPRETFSTFEAKFEATDFSPRELANALVKSAQDYAIISGQRVDKSVQVTEALTGLNQLESSTTYPLILALFAQRANGAIGHDQLAHAIDCLSGFILRRFVCGESSRGYGRMFARAVGKAGDDPFKLLEPYLHERGWPDDRRFQAAFVAFPLYQRGYTRAVLVALERDRKHKEPADLTDAEIEHILPQTLSDAWREALGAEAESIHAEWLHRPGNLTLSAYNVELWNHPFGKKRARYAESNIVLTRELADYQNWTANEIRERGEQLAQEAARIWIGPKEPVAVIQPGDGHASAVSGGVSLSNTKQLQSDYWTQFLSVLAVQDNSAKTRRPPAESWMSFGIGHSGFDLETFISVRKHHVGVAVRIAGTNKAEHFHKFYAQRNAIEEEIGEALTWYELPDKKSSYASLYLHDSDPKDRSLWPTQHAWIIDTLEAFRRCFSGRVEDLTAPAK